MSARISIAYHPSTRKYIHIDNVSKGDSEFICIKCKDPLIPRKGEVNIAHFSHKSNQTCSGESLLHKLAKQIILDANEIRVSENEIWTYNNAVAEKPFKKKTPDVTAFSNDELIIFEVAVTNPKDESTKSYYRSHKIRSVEIHLPDISPEASYERIKNEVLMVHQNKEIIFPTYVIEQRENNKESSYKFWLWIILAAIATFIMYKIFRRKG